MHLNEITRDTITSPADLIKLENQLIDHKGNEERSKRWGFRGQPRLYGRLTPSFERVFKDKGRADAAQRIERDLLDSFRSHYAKLPYRSPDMPSPSVIAQGFDLRCLSVMQHYGVPTRLLDWTSGIWIAAYFACASEPIHDAELWVYDRQMFRQQAFLDPLTKSLLRVASSGDNGSLSEPALLNMQGSELILELTVPITTRMREQTGLLTVSSDLFVDHALALLKLHREMRAIGASPVHADGVRRYVISGSCKAEMLRFLADQKQITAATIYPDLEGLGRFLRWHLESLLSTFELLVDGGENSNQRKAAAKSNRIRTLFGFLKDESHTTENVPVKYVGDPDGLNDCISTVAEWIGSGYEITRARLLTSGNHHRLLLSANLGLTRHVVVRSNLASGYQGMGPGVLSAVLKLLEENAIAIEEYAVSRDVLIRISQSALTAQDIEAIEAARPTRPPRWPEYVREQP
jgi:FRG domain